LKKNRKQKIPHKIGLCVSNGLRKAKKKNWFVRSFVVAQENSKPTIGIAKGVTGTYWFGKTRVAAAGKKKKTGGGGFGRVNPRIAEGREEGGSRACSSVI